MALLISVWVLDAVSILVAVVAVIVLLDFQYSDDSNDSSSTEQSDLVIVCVEMALRGTSVDLAQM
jgi:hypothetical protein